MEGAFLKCFVIHPNHPMNNFASYDEHVFCSCGWLSFIFRDIRAGRRHTAAMSKMAVGDMRPTDHGVVLQWRDITYSVTKKNKEGTLDTRVILNALSGDTSGGSLLANGTLGLGEDIAPQRLGLPRAQGTRRHDPGRHLRGR